MAQTRTEQVRVRWSNGHVDAADDWQDLLDKVRDAQWHLYDEATFRMVLGKRAMRWTSTEIDIDAPADELFAELQRARLVEILGPDDDELEA